MASSDIIGENKRLAQQFSDYVWTEQYDDLQAMCTADAVFHDPAFGPRAGTIDDLIEEFEEMHASMSDVEYDIEHMIAEGDYVFYRGRVEATHTGEMMGIAPTNRRVSAADHIELRFEDGKVAEAWAQYDAMGLMQQLSDEMPGAA